MKKIIKVLTVLLIMTMLFGCGKKKEELTVDNCENFFDEIRFDVSIDKSSKHLYKKGSNYLEFDTEIKGRENYKFNNVVLTVRQYYTYTSVQLHNATDQQKDIDIPLDENGCYSKKKDGYLGNETYARSAVSGGKQHETYIPKDNSYLDFITFDIDYEIVGVSGTVEAR